MAKNIEQTIREYLDNLGASNKPVVDKEAVKALKAQIKAEDDAINRLRLLSELERAEEGEVPDYSGLEAVFISEGKAWADGEGITGSAFSALGVSDDVLKSAGFTVSTKTKAPKSTGTRAPRLDYDDVKKAANKLGSGWKLSDLAEALGSSPATTRNYVIKLIEDGTISDLGEDPKHDGRGRAPKLYGKA
jgi:hypothetical protein